MSVIISPEQWTEAIIETAGYALDLANGRPGPPDNDDWGASFDRRPDGSAKGRVSGNVVTVYFESCRSPAHWPDRNRLAEAIRSQAEQPETGNLLKRLIRRIRLRGPRVPTLQLELATPAHELCWHIHAIPALLGTYLSTDADQADATRRSIPMPASPPTAVSSWRVTIAAGVRRSARTSRFAAIPTAIFAGLLAPVLMRGRGFASEPDDVIQLLIALLCGFTAYGVNHGIALGLSRMANRIAKRKQQKTPDGAANP